MDEKNLQTLNQSSIAPQPGPQTEFLSCPADIAVYGGAAGGGKSVALLLEPTRHHTVPHFSAVIFRRTLKQVMNKGSIWDASAQIYPRLHAQPFVSIPEWRFAGRDMLRVQFAGLEYDKDVYAWQGAEIPLIEWDELTHFTENQFFYMLSRNRSTTGIRPYVRATTNPDASSWVRRLIDWWIDNDTGLPIQERSGKIRWFVRENDSLIWGDRPEDLPKELFPKSFTFIPAKLSDNRILMAKDPGYLANLHALSRVERERLLNGNWNIQATAGTLFQRGWFEVVDAAPAGCRSVRYWDRASTPVDESQPKGDPDYTVGAKVSRAPNGIFYIEDITRMRVSPHKVERTVLNTAKQDGVGTEIGIEQDPGQAGVADALNYSKLLAGFNVRLNRVSTDKVTRALPASAQAEAGNVKILRGAWNEAFLKELENFPDDAHDDQVDAFSGALNSHVTQNVGTFTSEMAKAKSRGTISPSLKTGEQW